LGLRYLIAHCVALWLVELVSFMRSERGFWDGKDGGPTNIPKKHRKKMAGKRMEKKTFIYGNMTLNLVFLIC